MPPRSYFLGTHAPGRCANRTQCEEGDQIRELLKCSYHAMLAHAAVRLRQSLGVELDAYSWAKMLMRHTGQCLPAASAVSHAQCTMPASRSQYTLLWVQATKTFREVVPDGKIGLTNIMYQNVPLSDNPEDIVSGRAS